MRITFRLKKKEDSTEKMGVRKEITKLVCKMKQLQKEIFTNSGGSRKKKVEIAIIRSRILKLRKACKHKYERVPLSGFVRCKICLISQLSHTLKQRPVDKPTK